VIYLQKIIECDIFTEDNIPLKDKLADCLYYWERSNRNNHSTAARDLKLMLKVLDS